MRNAAWTLMFVAAAAFLLFCGIVYWQEYRTTSILSSRGVVTEGTLDPTYTENRRNGIAESYSVTYQFLAEGKTYKGESKLHARPATPTVKVSYDPKNPETNQIVGSENFYDSISILFAALIIGLALGIIRLVVSKFRS